VTVTPDVADADTAEAERKGVLLEQIGGLNVLVEGACFVLLNPYHPTSSN
jgi:hypothetical protein